MTAEHCHWPFICECLNATVMLDTQFWNSAVCGTHMWGGFFCFFFFGGGGGFIKDSWLQSLTTFRDTTRKCIICPMLFICFINDLPQDVKTNVFIFADDTKFTVTENNAILQQDLSNLQEWLEKWQLHFNTTKCKVMHLGIQAEPSDYFMSANNELFEYLRNRSHGKGSRGKRRWLIKFWRACPNPNNESKQAPCYDKKFLLHWLNLPTSPI